MAPVHVQSGRMNAGANAAEFRRQYFEDEIWFNREKWRAYRRCEPWDDRPGHRVHLPGLTWAIVSQQNNWPRGAVWPGIQPGLPPVSSQPTGEGWAPAGANSKKDDPTVPGKMRRVALKMDAGQSGLNFVRLLDWSGQAAIAIFDARVGNDADARTERFIVKARSSAADPRGEGTSRRALQREKLFLKEYFGRSAHIIQLAQHHPRRSGSRRQGLRPRPQRAQPAAAADNVPDVLILEYLPRGDLDKFFSTAGGEPRPRTPEPILWSMFGCLVRGLIALQNPPKQQARYAQGWREDGPPITEGTDGDDDFETDIVHWDLDARNVLLGDYECGDEHDKHNIAPVLKITDLGWSRDMFQDRDPGLARDPYWLHLYSRRIGKTGWYAPEQFTEEWDYVGLLPDPNPGRLNHRVAGNYTGKMNIFQVGMIMYTAITQCVPPDGAPWPQRMNFTTLPTPPGNYVRIINNAWTYGGHLDDAAYNSVSAELRELVKQCMCDDPAHRPDARSLLQEILRHHRQRRPPRLTPNRMRAWADRRINFPPPPQYRSRRELDDVGFSN
ncbi:kinase-like domain-containing protein [Cercophora newfieldiana]|uniref:Kinase-like domain-containing protein n=1 Tax=Cercophora newfieldiana TaxID=92897 RepID=A0AA39Y2B4_9PEZI|nr:kinase-like domain-containing protein [Cercophora newfieldiana]